MEFALDAFRGGCQALDQHLSSIYTQECPGLGVHLGELVQTVAISPSVFCLASISHSARWTAHHGLKHTGDWGGGDSSEPEKQQRQKHQASKSDPLSSFVPQQAC